MHTKLEAEAALKTLRGFIGRTQRRCLVDLFRCEERQFFFDKICELAATVAGMPKTYEQDGLGDEAMVHLHYFAGGAGNWWITEKDKEMPEEPGQYQAFGFADLGDSESAELGYISIVELLACGAELDFYWKPKRLADVKNEVYGRSSHSVPVAQIQSAPAASGAGEIERTGVNFFRRRMLERAG